MRRATAGPCSPRASFITDSVPTAPPSCSLNAACAAVRSRSRQRTTGATQLSNLKPTLMTSAGCSKVRPSIGAASWRCARSNSAPVRSCSAVSINASASRVASTIAVSITSWLVLPQ